MALVYILLILVIIGVLFVYLRVDGLVRKKRWDEWIKEKRIEEANEREVVKFYGSFDKLLENSPDYVLGKIIKNVKNAGIKLGGIEDFIITFYSVPIKTQKIMLNEYNKYFLASLEKKKEILVYYKNL